MASTGERTYSKRTVAPKITPITIPSIFQSYDRLGDGYSRGKNIDGSPKLDAAGNRFYGYPEDHLGLTLFRIDYMAVEGDDGKNSKLVIRHRKSRKGATDIIVNLTGYWNEFERPDLEGQFDSNFLTALSYTAEHGKRLEDLKRALVDYLYDYFHNQPAGKEIMRKVRIRRDEQQQKLERAEAPHYDKIVREVSTHILAKYHVATIWETKEMYYFEGGKHVPGAERVIEEEAQALFQYDVKTYMIEEIKNAIRRQTYHDFEEFDADINIINVKNGLWHIKEKILTPHTPDYLSLNQKEIICNRAVKCPRFEAFIDDILYPQQVKTLKQCLAYTFYRDTPHEIYVIMVGHGWNGKSKLMAVMTKIHGDAVSYVPFNDIERDLFSLAGLERKDMNFDNEPSGGVVRNGAVLKKLTGREMIRVQDKYEKAHNVRLHAKLFNSTNDIPNIDDESIGRYRREVVIMFPYTFMPNPDPTNPMQKLEIPDIEEQLTTEEELSGIFNMLMDELHDILYKQNKRIFIDMQDIESRRRHREILKRPIEYFVKEVIDVDQSMPEDTIRKDDLFMIYEEFSRKNSLNPYNKEQFGSKLKKVQEIRDKIVDGQRESTRDPITGKRARLWKGIKVKPAWLDQDKRDKQTSLLQLEKDEDDEEEGEDSSINKEVIENTEKKASDMSDLSKQNPEDKDPKLEKTSSSGQISRSDHPQNASENPFGDVVKPDLARTSGTSGTPFFLKQDPRTKFYKCSLCKFENLYRGSVEHHYDLAHVKRMGSNSNNNDKSNNNNAE